MLGVKGLVEKRRAGAFSGPCGLLVKECVGRPSGAHRHAIPSPTDIIISGCTEAGQTGEEREVKESEQRNFSDWGLKMAEGVVKEMQAHLSLA